MLTFEFYVHLIHRTAIDFSPQTASLLSPGLPPNFSATGYSPSGTVVGADSDFQYQPGNYEEAEDPSREFERQVWGT